MIIARAAAAAHRYRRIESAGRIAMASGAALVGAAGIVVTPGLAGATFGGAGFANGDIAFVGNCNGGVQQILYVPSSDTSQLPCSSYGQQTRTGTDAEPFYSADTKTVYFESSRGGSFAVYSIPAVAAGDTPGTPDGSGGFSDSATQITFPDASSQDFAPSVSADGTMLSFTRCASTCTLEILNLSKGTLSPQTTLPLAGSVNATTGEAYRSVFDPINASQVLYECSVTVAGSSYGHICLHTVGTPASSDVDLSNQAEATNPWPHTDENPDFKYDGSSILFDSTGGLSAPVAGGTPVSVPNMIFKMSFNPATASATGAAAVWGAAGQGHEIEPIFSPDGAHYAWAHYTAGSQVVTWNTGSFANAVAISPVGKSINSEPTWEGQSQPGTNLPETPLAILLPGGGLLAGGLALTLLSRRRRSAEAAG